MTNVVVEGRCQNVRLSCNPLQGLLEEIVRKIGVESGNFLGNLSDLFERCIFKIQTASSGEHLFYVECPPRRTLADAIKGLPPSLESIEILKADFSGRGAAVSLPLDLELGTIVLQGSDARPRSLSPDEHSCLKALAGI